MPSNRPLATGWAGRSAPSRRRIDKAAWEKKDMSEPVDQEVDAIRAVLAALAPLSEKAGPSVLEICDAAPGPYVPYRAGGRVRYSATPSLPPASIPHRPRTTHQGF